MSRVVTAAGDKATRFSAIPLFLIRGRILFFFQFVIRLFPILLRRVYARLRRHGTRRAYQGADGHDTRPVTVNRTPRRHGHRNHRREVGHVNARAKEGVTIPRTVPSTLYGNMGASNRGGSPFSSHFVYVTHRRLGRRYNRRATPRRTRTALPGFTRDLLLRLVRGVFLTMR